MRKYTLILSAVSIFLSLCALKAQVNNLVVNGSFENTTHPPCGPGEYKRASGISSSNNTSVDIYSVQSYSNDYSVPDNYMGSQLSNGGSNYAGIVAFYADEAGIFKTVPGYQKYSEYIQLELNTPLTAGTPYQINFNISLAERSAYAVSGLGVYLSSEKLDIDNNSFLNVTPHLIACEIVTQTNWETVNGTYVAKGGEKFLTLGCFNLCMDTIKIIPEFTNNSRKAYYFIDEVSVVQEDQPKEDLTSVLYGNCFRLQELSFEPNQSTILPESYAELNELSRFLRTYPFLVVYIDGYTDEINTTAEISNEQLSEARSLEVKKYLTAYGVRGDQLKARGFGSTNPIDPYSINNIKNERVEITVCVTE
ncbi:MAG: OmpA family protein [Bacteroidota bacterium]